MPVAAINTYSWHKGARGPQVYTVYGSDGAAAGFNDAPGIGTDPARQGWTRIADVDTRPADGSDAGGRYAVGIADPSAPGGVMGRWRYLLFVTFVTETDDMCGQTFYSEIDVVEGE